MIIFCHAIMKKASLIVKQSEVIAFLNIYILNKYNLSVALVVYGGVWMDYKTFGPLIMTHFLFAHPVGSPPSPFTHAHTQWCCRCSHTLSTWKFPSTRRIFYCREAGLSANVHLLGADSLEMPQ